MGSVLHVSKINYRDIADNTFSANSYWKDCYINLEKKAVTTQMLMGRIVSHFEEAMSGIKIIKAFNGRKYVQGNFEITNVAHQKNNRRMSYRQETGFSNF